jgi:DNA-binding transcriptional MocR family regulator
VSETTPARAAYDSLVARGLKLDLTRGKPSAAQLDLAAPLLARDMSDDYRAADGTDTRNYGGDNGQGLPELRAIFGELLHIPVEQLLALGNASLQIMHDTIVHALLHGLPGVNAAWRGEDVAFLCPSPGYDRHFAITEAFGIRMIPVPFDEEGRLPLDVIAQHLQDPAVKGMWCVPMFANPGGEVYDEETVKALVSLPVAADDFRLFWDNAYSVHVLTEDFPPVIDVLGLAAAAGNPDRVFVFASTSKITLAGGGVAFFGSSPTNIAWFRAHTAVQTIGPDKVNQLRHVRHFGDADGVRAIMQRHRAIIAPKFAATERILTDRLRPEGGPAVAHWTTPAGGYFIALTGPSGTATRAVDLAKAAGIAITPAGAAFPYSEDPEDAVIRVAPTFPSLEDLEVAVDGLCTCLLLAIEEREAA